MRVAVLCEYSGRVRDAFIKRGHDAISFDLLPSKSNRGQHVQGDITQTMAWWHGMIQGFDLVVAHPPCTYLANSGVRWLHSDPSRWEKLKAGAKLFKFCLSLNVPRVAVENPIMHKYAIELIGRRQDQVVQPWQFGHGETKATCLWLKNLPQLEPTNIVAGRESRIHRMAPSATRSMDRSLTYQGIADAMAEQWGSIDLR